MQILVQFAGNLSEIVCGKQSSLNLSLFLFFFCLIEKFLSSLNFESFLSFFFCRILGWIFSQLNFRSRTLETPYHEASDETYLLSTVLSVRSPHSHWWLNSSLTKRRKSLFGGEVSRIISPFSTPAKSSAARGWLDFFLERKFLKGRPEKRHLIFFSLQ